MGAGLNKLFRTLPPYLPVLLDSGNLGIDKVHLGFSVSSVTALKNPKRRRAARAALR